MNQKQQILKRCKELNIQPMKVGDTYYVGRPPVYYYDLKAEKGIPFVKLEDSSNIGT